ELRRPGRRRNIGRGAGPPRGGWGPPAPAATPAQARDLPPGPWWAARSGFGSAGPVLTGLTGGARGPPSPASVDGVCQGGRSPRPRRARITRRRRAGLQPAHWAVPDGDDPDGHPGDHLLLAADGVLGHNDRQAGGRHLGRQRPGPGASQPADVVRARVGVRAGRGGFALVLPDRQPVAALGPATAGPA